MNPPRSPSSVDAALARLKSEIALNREFTGLNEAAFVALVWTWQCLEKLGRAFFFQYGLTDAQFNVLMILWDYRDRALRQHELADILVVNRASMGGVLERMERNGWIERTADPEDRRAMRVRLSKAGVAKLGEIREPYYAQLAKVFPRADGEQQRNLILDLDTMRARLAPLGPAGSGTTEE